MNDTNFSIGDEIILTEEVDYEFSPTGNPADAILINVPVGQTGTIVGWFSHEWEVAFHDRYPGLDINCPPGSFDLLDMGGE